MANELELKAVLSEPEAVRRALAAARAREGFRGLMRDRRFDRGGELGRRDEVLRVRLFEAGEGSPVGGSAVLGWKGPMGVSPNGYKQREEIELETGDAAAATHLIQALGFAEVHAIDRYVEIYQVLGAVIRLEWYPRMDALIEVEGGPEAIEAAIALIGIPRSTFLAAALAQFAAGFEARTNQAAALSEAELAGGSPPWPRAL